MASNSLADFHPLIRQWFTETYPAPTDIQAQSWPKIAAGEHVLITAPTGSGKTLTAFLWALNQLAAGEWETGKTRVLYVSPLKALNNDIRRNLISPLQALRNFFEANDNVFPQISALTRSGDTPQADRRKMLRHPPDILITTPESLNLLLSSKGGRSMLPNLKTVILDEIHAVIDGKRGAHLITGIERLVPLAGEFQRIALSATVRPMETVAKFIGGFMLEGEAPAPVYKSRTVALLKSTSEKKYDMEVRFPEAAVMQDGHESVWHSLVKEFKEIVATNRSTLLFTNGRRLAEKLTAKINMGEDYPVAYAHHGSLSRQIRETVESKLKAGDLKAIVATSSLEMGIDIGALDEVVLIQSPPSISSAIQRIGRAGHQVGETSRGTLFPTHARDFLDAAVLAQGILKGDIENIRPVECPLDVLSQVIISMVGVEAWDIDELYAQIKTAYPYRNLAREQFDQVLKMLAGRYADRQVRELKPRVSIDRIDNTVVARAGALQTLYMSGGTIPDRGYFHLRHMHTNARIGELDEEFVWENGAGSNFTLGNQTWHVEKVTHNEVLVLPGNPRNPGPPFWKAEENSRDYHFSERIGEFLEAATNRLDDPVFKEELQQDHFMDKTAAMQLINYLKKQKKSTGTELPHRHHVLIEYIKSGPGGSPGNQVVIHTFWGGNLNRPYSMALQAAWEEKFGHQIEVYSTEDSIVLQMPDEVRAHDIMTMVSANNVQPLLRKQLEGSGFFGARFRESAGRALLLTRSKINQRMPLWLSRLKSQKLLDAVMRYDDFPILLETWRTCLQDEFELDALQHVLSELESGLISWSEVHTNFASPFAQSVTWRQINQYMYMDDRPMSGKQSQLRNDLLRDVVFTPGLRPEVDPEIVETFELKRQRLAPGYSPQSSRDLLDWMKERVLLPLSEWENVLKAIERDHDVDRKTLLTPVFEKLAKISPTSAEEPLIAALEMLPQIIDSMYIDDPDCAVAVFSAPEKSAPNPDWRNAVSGLEDDNPEALASDYLGNWLQYYGPRTVEFIAGSLGIPENNLQRLLDDLIDAQQLISGVLIRDHDVETVCDAESFEILLRIMRAGATPQFEALEIEKLPLFLAQHQGLTRPKSEIDDIYRSIEQLAAYPMEAGMWEQDVLPSRFPNYAPSMLDTIMLDGNLKWIGSENGRVLFCFNEDLELIRPESEDAQPIETGNGKNSHPENAASTIDRLFPESYSRYDFSTLMQISELPAGQLADELWKAVWKGEISNDTFMALRRGIMNRFKVPSVSAAASPGRSRRRWPPGRRGTFQKWKGAVPFAGNWYKLSFPELAEDLLEVEERNKDRVRLLLDRHGILFRELVARELPEFRWANIFRSLRLMELAGEVFAGYFFHGIPGPQFMSRQAFQMINRNLPEDAIFFINAHDPASTCGLPLEGLRGNLPKRLAGNHLIYHGSKLVMVSERLGKSLTINVPADDPHLQEYFACLRHLLSREFQPLRRISVETINGEEAPKSEYVDAMRISFDVSDDYKKVDLHKKRGE